MKKLHLLKTVFLLCALVVGSLNGWAVEQVYKTLSFTAQDGTKKNSYESSWTETVGTDTWTIVNFNNNNWGWSDGDYKLIKCGRKRTGSSSPYTPTPSVSTITTGAAIDEAITKVVVTLTAINASDYNSIKLYMASNAAFTEDVVTVNVSPIPTTVTSPMTITIPEANRAANRYYKIEFDTKGETSSNGHTGVKKVEYYYDYVSSATLDHIELGGTCPTEFYVGDVFSYDGLTVTAHYDDLTTANVTTSATVSAPDMSSAGVKTITVTYEENSVEKTATYDITVSPVPPVVLTLDFAENIFGLPVGSGNKKTASTDYSYGGYTYTLAAADGFYYLETTTPSSYKCLFIGKSGSTLTFPEFPFKVKRIKVYGTPGASTGVKQNIFVGDTPISTETTGAQNVTNVYTIPSAYQAIGTIYVLKVTSAHNTQISKIEILGDGEAVEVSSVGLATFASDSKLDFTNVPDLEAYIAKENVSKIELEKVNKVPAGIGVLLRAKNGTTAFGVPVTTAATDDVTGNLFVRGEGTAVAATAAGKNNYLLAKRGEEVAFFKANGTKTVATNQAYLATTLSAGARINLNFDADEATAIINVESEVDEMSNATFNLAGQRVAQPTKGLYIVNGKKVIVK